MALTEQQMGLVQEKIKASLRNKFTNYKPEPAVMPFHTRLLGKDRLALYSFIHSLNTNFGTTIYEPVATIIALDKFKFARRQEKSGARISTDAHAEIQKIMDELTTASRMPNKEKEIAIIRDVCRSGEISKVRPSQVDLYLETHSKEIYLIDLKTAKPNRDGFKALKRTLLEWTAAALYENPDAKIHTLIAIPYNPYEPEPYERWTMQGMFDLEKELKVAADFGDFLGGKGTYDNLLDCFQCVGIAMREEIDDYFSKFRND